MTLQPIAFASKSLTSTEKQYSDIKREILCILHGQEKFLHYCFACKVSVITDNKPLIAIFKKICGRLVTETTKNNIMHPPIYNIRILYKIGLQLFIGDWLSRHNHEIGKDEEIHRTGTSINTIETCMNIPECKKYD